MFIHFSAQTRRIVGLALASTLLGGCATTSPSTSLPYTPELAQNWKRVDLAVDMVEPTLQQAPGGAVPVMVSPSPAALVLGVVVSQVLQAGAAASTEAGNALTESLRTQLLDLDLPGTLRADILAHAPPTLQARLQPSSLLLPTPDQSPRYDQALVETARRAPGDALLAVRLWPMPRSKYVVPGLLVQVRLLDRQGTMRRSADLWILTDNPPPMDAASTARWWEEDRWRRFVRQGLQASAMAIGWRLEPQLQDAANESRFADLKGADATLELESSRVRTSHCALDARDDQPLVHRYERMWLEIRVGTLCADEARARVPDGGSPLVSRAMQAPPLQAAVPAAQRADEKPPRAP